MVPSTTCIEDGREPGNWNSRHWMWNGALFLGWGRMRPSLGARRRGPALRFGLAAVLGAALAAIPAHARTADLPQPGCFEAVYSARDLAAAPDQVVRRLVIWIGDDLRLDHGREVRQRLALTAALTVEGGRAGRSGLGGHLLTHTLECGQHEDGHPFCLAECEGGEVLFAENAPDRIVLQTTYLLVGRLPGQMCDGAFDISNGDGSKTRFVLTRVSTATCRAIWPDPWADFMEQ